MFRRWWVAHFQRRKSAAGAAVGAMTAQLTHPVLCYLALRGIARRTCMKNKSEFWKSTTRVTPCQHWRV
ncbi:hypothetical protein V5799_002340 [Amblyomma americanum]|uniref:Uncharacterized protein n=1 Tax=Amblyomma americanum TaxID=6943 RepID=A0AAQ4CXM0_AMBAM